MRTQIKNARIFDGAGSAPYPGSIYITDDRITEIADLLLVDDDPTEDVGIMQDKSHLKMVMKGGELCKAPHNTVYPQ